MCFYKSLFNRSKIATEDIDVIKVLVKRKPILNRHEMSDTETPTRTTPYMHFPVTPEMVSKFTHGVLSRQIHTGLHAYAMKHHNAITIVGDFVGLARRINALDSFRFSVAIEAVRATIPKGTRYYIAKQPNGDTHYVAERLLVHTDDIIKRIHTSILRRYPGTKY